jgi:hypothetical protein
MPRFRNDNRDRDTYAGRGTAVERSARTDLLLANVATACARSALDRLPAGVGDYDEVNLDRLFADSHCIGHHRCEPEQYQAGDQLPREPMGEHQGLGNAARNVGKPPQCAALVGCHAIVLV